MNTLQSLGRKGEDLAAGYLKKLGYRIIGRNVVNSLGELDLVADDGRCLVVVEVKTRSSSLRPPSEAVNFRKRRKLCQVAALFLKTYRDPHRPLRFDVVEVICPEQGAPVINHIRAAFEAAEGF